jgi:hypothetical protein
MAERSKPYEIEGDSENYLQNVATIESAPWNRPGSDKTWVEQTVVASDEHFRRAVLVR